MNFSGVFPPLPTSFFTDQKLAPNHIKANLDTLMTHPLAGVLVLGSNGELVMLSEEERKAVYNTARKSIPDDKLMIAGTGGQSTLETIRLTKAASDAGADAVLILNPSYYKGLMTDEALKQHYHDVADQSSVPVLIYNMPANSGMDMSADTILGIAEHPNIVGLKDSGGNLVKMGQIIEKAKDGFQVLAGSAGFLLPAMSLGAVGGILALANIAPVQCTDLHRFVVDGKFSEARDLQRKLIELNTAVTRGWGVPALKAAMDHLGMYGGPCRKPIQPLKPSVEEKLIALIKQTLNK